MIENNKKNRGLFFKGYKAFIRIFKKKPKYVFLGEEFKNSSIIISNHESTKAPLALELYIKQPIKFWGAHEMNEGFFKMYSYQTKVYYHEKKHWNLFLARMFCLLATPLTNFFYKGLRLISTYQDTRFRKTLRESLDALKEGQNIVIFPEVSDKGYLAELEGLHNGFLLLCEYAYKNGIDTPIVVSYFQRNNNIYVFDSPILYSDLVKEGLSRDEIADKLRLRCNELGKMKFEA